MASRIFKNLDLANASKETNPFILPCLKHMIYDDSISNDAIVNYIYDILPAFPKVDLKGRFAYLSECLKNQHMREDLVFPVDTNVKGSCNVEKCMACYSSVCKSNAACDGCPRHNKNMNHTVAKNEEICIKFLLDKKDTFSKYYPTIKDNVHKIFVCNVDLNQDVQGNFYVPYFKPIFADTLEWIDANTSTFFNSISMSRDLVVEQYLSYLYGRYDNPPEIMVDMLKSLASDVLYGYVNSNHGTSEKDFYRIVESKLKEKEPKKKKVDEPIIIGAQLSLFDELNNFPFEEETSITEEANVSAETPSEAKNEQPIEEIKSDEEIKSNKEVLHHIETTPIEEKKEEEKTVAMTDTLEEPTKVSEEVTKDETPTDETLSSENTVESNDNSVSEDTSADSEEFEDDLDDLIQTAPPTTNALDDLDVLSGDEKEESDNEISEDANENTEEADAEDKEEEIEDNITENDSKGVPTDVPFLSDDNYIIDNRQDICLEYSMDLSLPGAIMDFENAVLKDKFMSIEAIQDKNGKEILIFRSRRGSVPFFHVYMDNKECMDYIAPYLSRRSFVKICYQPYFLYAYCRKYNAPLKRVYSICTCHSLIISEYTREDVSTLKVLSYRKTLESYMNEEWKENIPALLAGMNVYAYIVKQQERELRVVEKEGMQSMLCEMDELVYYDEALGLSYKLDSLFIPSTNITTLFKLTGHNEFDYFPIDTVKTKPAGKFVEFIIDTELTRLEYAHQIIHGVIVDLVENGRFRKINIYILEAKNNVLKLFIPEYYFHHLMTILSSTFTSVARKNGIENLNYKTVIKKAESTDEKETAQAL